MLVLLSDYPTVFAACTALAPKFDVGVERLRKWVVQAQVDSGTKAGPSSAELEEIKQLKKENRDFKEANEMADSFAQRFLDNYIT